ncbi:MAG: fluoride exporter [Actinomycetota bacterium]|nr:fluoride exporter [Actinomycetota bacterium]
MLGTALRLGCDVLVPHTDTQFPFDTLVINVLGSFALAALVARVWRSASPVLRAGLGTGLLGGFTTFSAVMVSLVSLTASSQPGLAVAYLAMTMIAGLVAAAGGLALGSRSIPIGTDE